MVDLLLASTFCLTRSTDLLFGYHCSFESISLTSVKLLDSSFLLSAAWAVITARIDTFGANGAAHCLAVCYTGTTRLTYSKWSVPLLLQPPSMLWWNTYHIRSFHSSFTWTYFEADEGQFFLGCLNNMLKHIISVFNSIRLNIQLTYLASDLGYLWFKLDDVQYRH
jgi:hypothetical protein